MKWGKRKAPTTLGDRPNDRSIAKKIKKDFKDDVKVYKKGGLKYEAKYDKMVNSYIITQWYDSRNKKVGHDYVEKVMKQAIKDRAVKSMVGSTLVITGAAIVGTILGDIK